MEEALLVILISIEAFHNMDGFQQEDKSELYRDEKYLTVSLAPTFL